MKTSFLTRCSAGLALSLLVAVLAVFPQTGWGQDKGDGPPVTIEADRLNYDEEGDTYDASGNVVIRYEEGILKADDVRVSRVTGESEARGGVELQSGADVLKGESARFNFRDKTGVLYDGEVFFSENHLFLKGRELHKEGEATYRVVDGKATTCDGEAPDWSVTGKEIRVTVDGYGTIRHGAFRVCDVPVFYVPYFLFPVKKTRQTGLLLPRLAYSRDKNGLDISIPFFIALSDRMDATLYQRYMEKRGFQEGLEFRYCQSADSYGVFYGDVLRDEKEVSEKRGRLSRTWTESRDRWSLYWNHQVTLKPGLYGVVDIKRVSDSWYLRDFSSDNYFLRQYGDNQEERFRRINFYADDSLPSLDSTARVVKDWEWFNLMALGQYTDNFQEVSNDNTLQKYPEITLTGFTRPLSGTPFQLSLDSAYDYYDREEGTRGHLLNLYPELALPFGNSPYFKIIPRVGFRFVRWDAASEGDSGDGTRGDMTFLTARLEGSTEFSRVFHINGKSVEKIKHTVRPEVEYTYIPSVAQEDRPDFTDPVVETNRVTYSLVNALTARGRDSQGRDRYWEFFRLELGQSYDIREARRDETPEKEKRPFGAIEGKLYFRPLDGLSLWADTRFDPNDGEWKKTDCLLSARDGRGDRVTVEYRYTQDRVEELNLALRLRCTNRLDIGYILEKNRLDDRTVEATYALRYRRQCWGIELRYSEKDDDRLYLLSLELLGIGEGGVEGSASW